MKTLKLWYKVLTERFLSECLLLGLSVFVLVLLSLMAQAYDHSFVVQEPRVAILVVDIALCVLIVGWSIGRLVRTFRRSRRPYAS